MIVLNGFLAVSILCDDFKTEHKSGNDGQVNKHTAQFILHRVQQKVDAILSKPEEKIEINRKTTR